MDPNECLRLILKFTDIEEDKETLVILMKTGNWFGATFYIRQILCGFNGQDEFVQHVLNLRKWITNGGFAPDWDKV